MGGPVILQSLINIDRLSEAKINLTAAGLELIDGEDVGPLIDITPEESLTSKKDNKLTETLTNRWELLAGL